MDFAGYFLPLSLLDSQITLAQCVYNTELRFNSLGSLSHFLSQLFEKLSFLRKTSFIKKGYVRSCFVVQCRHLVTTLANDKNEWASDCTFVMT